jgi:hypothetical protein
MTIEEANIAKRHPRIARFQLSDVPGISSPCSVFSMR